MRCIVHNRFVLDRIRFSRRVGRDRICTGQKLVYGSYLLVDGRGMLYRADRQLRKRPSAAHETLRFL